MRAFGKNNLVKTFNVSNRKLCKFNNKRGSIHADDMQYPEFYVNEASLYVHWPYCRKRCHFCNFNKYIDNNVDHQRMRNCLVTEIKTIIKETRIKRINSVFFGGGTPNLAEPITIEAILKAVASSTELIDGAEITMETNPIGYDTCKLEDFKAAGINRVSVGVQALDDCSLSLLGRDHTVQDALKTLDLAKMLFPKRTSVDILYGLPERGTKFFKMCEEGKVVIPEEDVLADMYNLTLETLESSGFSAYEISNFSRSLDARSTHNQAYWQGKQYIGIGPGAHSRFIPQGTGSSSYNSELMGSEEKQVQGMREARIQTLEPIPWMREVESVGHGTRLRRQQKKRYINDAICCWTGSDFHLDYFLKILNSQHSRNHFTMEKEQGGFLNFLDLKIALVDNKHMFGVYQKPSYNDLVIPADSCHPTSHREVLGELLAVGLRTSEGVTRESWRALSSKAPTLSECFAESPRLAWLFENGLLKSSTSDSISATRIGWRVLDHIVPHLLDELERALCERGM